jgi:hypothetical protein
VKNLQLLNQLKIRLLRSVQARFSDPNVFVSVFKRATIKYINVKVPDFHICNSSKERAKVINIAETPNRAGEQAGGEAGRHKQIWEAQLVLHN